MVPLNYNFIFCTHGTTRILHCIPVTCLCGTHLLLTWNVHISWKYTHVSTHLVEVHAKNYMWGSTCKEVHTWKYMRGSIHAWNKTHMYYAMHCSVIKALIAVLYACTARLYQIIPFKDHGRIYVSKKEPCANKSI